MAIAALALAGAVLAACGSSHAQGEGGSVPLAGSHTNLATSWVLVHDGSFATLLTWTITGTSAEGNFVLSDLDSSGLSIDTETVAFKGFVSGSSVTLNFNTGVTETGAVTAGHLRLDFPGGQGSVTSLTLVPGTIGTYNAAVSSIKKVVNANEKVASEKSSIETAAQTVASDVSSIDFGIANLQSDASGLQNDLAFMRRDEETTQYGLSMVNQDVNNNDDEACGDAESVAGDAESVQGDMESLQGGESTANSDLSALRQALSSLPTDWSAYERASAVLSSYESQYAVTSSQEQSALAQGTQESSKFVVEESQDASSGQSWLTMANEIAATAQAEASNATSGGC